MTGIEVNLSIKGRLGNYNRKNQYIVTNLKSDKR
jgi:hypothetical protein